MTEQLLDDVKALLGITDDAYDAAAEIIIEQTAAEICAYCRIDEVPSEMYGLAALMCAEELRRGGYAGFSDGAGVKSVAEGDTEITYSERDTEASVFELYRKRLDPFRNKMGRLPNEIS